MGFDVYRDAAGTRPLGSYATIEAALAALPRNGLLLLPPGFVPLEPLLIGADNVTLSVGAPGVEVELAPTATRLTLTGPFAAEVTTGGANLTVVGSDAGLVLHGGAGRDNVLGGAGRDHLDGGAGNDVLSGGGGDDVLDAGTGRDRLDGGAGDDVLSAHGERVTLTGGDGADVFVLDAAVAGTAIISDFDASEGDLIVIRGGPADAAAASFAREVPGQTVITVGGLAVQVEGATRDDLQGHVASEVPPPDTTFGSVEEFLASGVAGEVASVTIDGVTWNLREGEPPHEGFKAQDASGAWWSPDYLIVVAAGQSNMTGSGTGGDMTLSGNVMAWDWVNDALVEASYAGAPANGPGIRTGTTLFNNLYFPFAEELSAEAGQPVLVVAHPVAGSQIETWVGPGDVNWDALEADIAQALAATGQDGVDAFLWLQGESDYPDPQATYEAQVNALIAQVRTASWGGTDVPILIGELSREGVNQAQNAALQHLEQTLTDPYLAFVSSTGLHTTSADGVHYDGASLVELGSRFLEAYADVADGQPAPHANTAPTVAAGAAIPSEVVVVEGQELLIDTSGWFADAEGDDLWFYGTLSKRGVYLVDPVDGGLVIDPDFAAAGTYTLKVYANDYLLDGPSVSITLRIVDAAPGVAVHGNGGFSGALLQTATFAEAMEALPRSRGVDVLRQDALLAVNAVTSDSLTVRGAAGVTGTFALAEPVVKLTLAGSAAFDVNGSGQNNYLVGNDGANVIKGLGGSDRLYGGNASDRLEGGAGADSLYGDAGSDRLMGGADADRAWGGGGTDTFVFDKGQGEMRVMDWQDGQDRIEVSGFAGIGSVQALFDAAVETQSGGRVTIALGADKLVIDNCTLAQLGADDFVFLVA